MSTLLRFNQHDAEQAWEQFGFNCGPAAIAAIAGLTIAELKPYLGNFASKRYTNPTLMWDILRSLKLGWTKTGSETKSVGWPTYGLARIQWEGPWMNVGVPIQARYRHTHWVAVSPGSEPAPDVFDVNALHAGGWIPLGMWATSLVPWIIENLVSKGDGGWHITHAVEIDPSSLRDRGIA